MPTDAALGRHMIESLMDAEFDVGRSSFLDPSKGGPNQGRHRARLRLCLQPADDRGDVITAVPVMLNTYYPPNQPTPRRCYNLGRALRSAIESWPQDIRVGILASGGLSHFVVDEELDQQALNCHEGQERGQADGPTPREDKLRQLGNPQLDGGYGSDGAPGNGRCGLRAVLPFSGGNGLRDGVRHLELRRSVRECPGSGGEFRNAAGGKPVP